MPRRHFTAESYSARNSVGYLLRRSLNLILPRYEALFADHGFTFVQWAVLMYLREGLAQTASDICRDFNYDSGALTRVVDQLEQRGLIERSRSTSDRRLVELALTDEGRAATEATIPLVVDFFNLVFEDFSEAEVATLIELLHRTIERLQQLPSPPEADR
ncbi:MAG: MarR family transcriptional regulator [Alphaproteobacteria bacterium]|nr:MarR family transcriptional regulator [Alphaproteobacteria bacterium]